MFRSATIVIVYVSGSLCMSPAVVAAEPRVEMELAFDRGLPLTAPQKWSRVLANAGVSRVKLRAARGGETATIDTLGTGSNVSYHVFGILIDGNQLVVPGGRFRLGDQQKIEQWLERLRQDGPELLTAAERPPFGLTVVLLKRVRDDLQQPVTSSTKGQDPHAVMQRVERKLSIPLQVDREAIAALRTAGPIVEELQGLSSGTVLAAVLRPLGLALVPQRQGQKVRYVVRRATAEEDIWPIGWPPKEKRQALAPQLFDILPVKIDDFPLTETLAAIGQRIEIPMLLDHNTLARHAIDTKSLRVSYPGKKSSYSLVLRSILAQVGLRGELRLDDAGSLFFWITTLKRS